MKPTRSVAASVVALLALGGTALAEMPTSIGEGEVTCTEATGVGSCWGACRSDALHATAIAMARSAGTTLIPFIVFSLYECRRCRRIRAAFTSRENLGGGA